MRGTCAVYDAFVDEHSQRVEAAAAAARELILRESALRVAYYVALLGEHIGRETGGTVHVAAAAPASPTHAHFAALLEGQQGVNLPAVPQLTLHQAFLLHRRQEDAFEGGALAASPPLFKFCAVPTCCLEAALAYGPDGPSPRAHEDLFASFFIGETLGAGASAAVSSARDLPPPTSSVLAPSSFFQSLLSVGRSLPWPLRCHATPGAAYLEAAPEAAPSPAAASDAWTGGVLAEHEPSVRLLGVCRIGGGPQGRPSSSEEPSDGAVVVAPTRLCLLEALLIVAPQGRLPTPPSGSPPTSPLRRSSGGGPLPQVSGGGCALPSGGATDALLDLAHVLRGAAGELVEAEGGVPARLLAARTSACEFLQKVLRRNQMEQGCAQRRTEEIEEIATAVRLELESRQS